MKKRLNPEMIDDENPEWTEADFKRARPAREMLPEILGEKVSAELFKRKPGQRGKQIAPKKELVTIRLNTDTLEFFRSMGPGWQTRMNAALKEWVKEHRT